MMRRPTLAGWMLIAMGLGTAFGALAPPGAAQHFAIVPKIFLRLIQAVIAPVLLGVLITAGAGAGSAREFGRLAMRAAIYFELMTAAALLTGWGAVWLVQPGRAFHFASSGAAAVRRRPRRSLPRRTWSPTRCRRACSMRWRAATFCRS